MALYCFLLLPLSFIAFWRGKSDTIRLLEGNNSFLKPAIEGIILGFVFWFFFHIFGIFKVALAAGTIYDGVVYSPLTYNNIIGLIIATLPSLIIFIGIGSIVSSVISIINRIILKLLRI